LRNYILARLWQGIIVVVLLAVFVFILVDFAPGSPATFMAGPNPRPEDITRIEKSLGLDRPTHEQLFIWLGKFARLDFGESFMNRRPALEVFLERLPATALLMGAANVFSLLIAIPLGLYAGLKRGKLSDNILTAVAVMGYSIPAFWFGIILLYIFAVNLHWLPLSGMMTPGAGVSIPDILKHLLMPCAVLTFMYTAYWMRFVRAGVIEVLRMDYVLLGRAKGLTENAVVVKHVLRNALLPLITVIGLSVPELFVGAVVIEAVFGWPGLGMLIYISALNRDLTVVMCSVVIAGLSVIAGNLMADIAYSYVDPRVKL